MSLVVATAVFRRGDIPTDATMWVMLALTVGAEAYSVTFPSGPGVSLSYPLSLAALVLFGPAGGVLVAAASSLASVNPKSDGFVGKVAFNFAQVVLSAALAGWSYMGLGGRALAQSPLVSQDFPMILLPVVAAVAVSTFVNHMLVGVYYVLGQHITWGQFWHATMSWVSPTQAALGLLGMAIAQVVAIYGLIGLSLFAAPLLVARETYNRFVSLRDAYADTVRSLVAAIEAKDPYTKGHSLRVAEYSVAIAEALGLPADVAERLEYAALLHDLGKLELRPEVLRKPSPLTSLEVQEVHRHPIAGAEIISSVDYLADIAPLVQGHHERLDGTGYAEGLAGDQIPLGARILAVADAFDAMTSERPYRAGLDPTVALERLRLGSGTQFDPVVVEAFVRQVPTRPGIEAEHA